MDNFAATERFSVTLGWLQSTIGKVPQPQFYCQNASIMVALRVGLPVVNCIAARNQNGVLSHREWTTLRSPRGSGLPWAGCSQPLGKSLSRKALAAVLLPKRFDHGCSAGGLASGELHRGPESKRSLEPP